MRPILLFARRRLWVLPLVFAGLAVIGFTGRTASTASAASALTVVELFTSQGCSSCPPADALLSELAKRDNILPLAFHIDYWDRLGWKDPFSLAEATARQRAYARTLGKSNVYTPQMMINGTRDVVGSNRIAVTNAIAGATPVVVPVGLTAGKSDLAIRVGSGMGEGKLWLVTFDPRHETQVRAGENAGRKLVNVNIVRSLEMLGDWNGQEVALSQALPPAGRGAALLLQGPSGRILGAGAIRLPAAS